MSRFRETPAGNASECTLAHSVIQADLLCVNRVAFLLQTPDAGVRYFSRELDVAASW